MKQRLESILRQVEAGELSPEKALSLLGSYPYSELDFAKVDLQREVTRGTPEVIYSPGKTPAQIAAIAAELRDNGSNVLATRLDPAAYEAVSAILPGGDYKPVSRTLTFMVKDPDPGVGTVAVVTAGTSDIPVAEEAAVTSEFLGNRTERVFDVGVAGLHRLFGRLDALREARVIITVAGMEGALPSVVAGLVKAPVIAVPTSIGYGASFHGLAALLAMLNSCPGGVAVVNIDNGFGAALMASQINHL